MGYYDFPHTRNYDSDLGFLIKKYYELGKDYDSLVAIYEKIKKYIADIDSNLIKYTKQFTIETLEKWLDDGTLEEFFYNLDNKIDEFIKSVQNNTVNIAKINENINDINVKVNSLSVLTPSGTFNNINELKNNFPNGNDNIYVTLDNGNWNYWNGTEWVSGGQYTTNVGSQNINRYDVNFLNDFYVDYKTNIVEGKYYNEEYVLTDNNNIDSTTFINTNNYQFIKLFTKNNVNIPNNSIICFKNKENVFFRSTLIKPLPIENNSYLHITLENASTLTCVFPIPVEAVSFTIALMHDHIDDYLIILSNNANMLSPANILINENNYNNMTSKYIDFILPLLNSENLIDYSNPSINGGYINNGQFNNALSYSTSNYINLIDKNILIIINQKMFSRKTNYILNYFDNNQEFISTVIINKDVTYYKVNPPDNATYCTIVYFYGYNNVLAIDMNTINHSPLIEANNNVYNNITLNIIGDSIQYGYGNQESVGYLLSKYKGYLYNNKSVSGACLSNNTRPQYKSIYQQYIELNKNDIIFINGGTNDYQYNSTLENENDFDINTVLGSLGYIFNDGKNKGLKIVYIFPHKILNWWNVPNTKGDTFQKYHDKIKELCAKYDIPFVDISQYLSSQNTVYKNQFYNKDGIHPTTKLNKLYYLPLALEFL